MQQQHGKASADPPASNKIIVHIKHKSHKRNHSFFFSRNNSGCHFSIKTAPSLHFAVSSSAEGFFCVGRSGKCLHRDTLGNSVSTCPTPVGLKVCRMQV